MSPATEHTDVRIQIVEDERIVALDLKQDLEAMGYRVCGVAASESHALELARREPPDLVLMDINLGAGGDGTRAAKRLMDEYRVPVVYLTAYAEPETLKRAGLTAPYGYLLKPFELRELNATIHMALARRRVERQAERAEQRYRLALDAGQLGVLEFGASGNELELHGHATPLFERGPPPSLTREGFMARLDAVSQARLGSLRSQPGQDLHALARWQLGPEHQLWLEIHARHFVEEARIIGVFRDVSSQVDSEAQLRQAAVVFESAADAIVILDVEGRLRAVNPAFCKLTGWQASEVLGARLTDILHAQRQTDLLLHAPHQQAEARHGEVLCKRRDGSQFPAWEHVAPVFGTDGRLSHQVLSFTDISALRRAETQIQHLAFHDALTGLGNRHRMDFCLKQFIAASDAKAEGGGFALCFLDLDGFKTINDTLGHHRGDELLVTVAQRLCACLRRSDIAIRLGGDEFVILLNQLTQREALLTLADKLLTAVREPVLLDGTEPVSVSASLGLALFPEHASTADELVKAADTAMYAAKSAGRNRCEIYDSQLAARAVERLQIEQGLRRARVGEQLQLHWQPIVEMASGRVIGAEALLRWQHPEYGPISPERFIPIAEESGLIEDIGRAVLQEACRQGRAWLDAGLRLERVAVNVSARQLQREGFADGVRQALLQQAFPAERLELELTESALQTVDSGQRLLGELRRLGVRLAIDDFGTGFSSLSMLKYFPLDRLKIDRSFVRDLETDPNDQAITRAIVALARALGLALTAEGVETEAQRQALQALGVEEAQGWLFCKAVPAHEFALRQVQAELARHLH
ncbi:two-component system response regulator [Roseateles sp. DB2]|uniref:two-component system response regulator n=1 Tax=Roseateles sp. DB2 TaxID=3453717 RepID=UPI003EED1204